MSGGATARTLCDVDVGPGGTALLHQRHTGLVLAVGGGEHPINEPLDYPCVRWVRPGLVLLVGRRSDGENNALLVTTRGEVVRSFFVGDGIEEVMVCGSKIVIAYFDEGVFGDFPAGREGIAVFDTQGEMEWGYHTAFGAEAVPVVDTYGACTDGVRRVWFSPSRTHPLIELDLERRTQRIRPLPPEVHGCTALSVAGESVYFAFPDAWLAMWSRLPDATTIQDLSIHHVLRWNASSGAVARAGTADGPLRGLPNGRFMEVRPDGWRVVSPS